jgi:hypothetical protein
MASSQLIRWDPSAYLSSSELLCIDQQFDRVLRNEKCLVFWTGVNRLLVQCWADKHNLMTLVGALGPLFDSGDPQSPKRRKSSKGWSKYMKGASGRFAEYACKGRRALVLTNPPPNIYGTRTRSTFRSLEEPILTGAFGGSHVIRIDYVHPMVEKASNLQYQIWPVNRSRQWTIFWLAQEKRETRQKRVECEHKEAQQRKEARRREVEEQEKQAQERRDAKRRKVEEQERRAQERRDAKRRKVEEQESGAQKRRDAARQRLEEQHRQAIERINTKQKRMEEQHKQALERMNTKQKCVVEQQRQAIDKRSPRKNNSYEIVESRPWMEAKEVRRYGLMMDSNAAHHPLNTELLGVECERPSLLQQIPE